jgi:hypothetical protein
MPIVLRPMFRISHNFKDLVILKIVSFSIFNLLLIFSALEMNKYVFKKMFIVIEFILLRCENLVARIFIVAQCILKIH